MNDQERLKELFEEMWQLKGGDEFFGSHFDSAAPCDLERAKATCEEFFLKGAEALGYIRAKVV